MIGSLYEQRHMFDQFNVKCVKFYNCTIKCDMNIVNFNFKEQYLYIKWEYSLDIINTNIS